MTVLILFFLIAGMMICFARRLTVSGERLGDVLGMEASWVGALLLASITSLPELIVGVSSVFLGNHSMAVSNIFGSNIFNVFIIFLMDIFILRRFIFMSSIDGDEGRKLSKLSLVLIVLFLGGYLMRDVSVLGQSPFILGIILLYLRFIRSEGGQGSRERRPFSEIMGPLKSFLLDSTGVVVLGIALSRVADTLSITPIMGWVLGQSLVGGLLLAVSTSLPELIVSIESVRRGGFQQAMGNILGSNLFNLGTLFILDIFTKGSLFSHLGDFNTALPLMDIAMQVIFITGICFRRKEASLLMGAVYAISLYFII
ncbi:sodium:calcium antiporter [Propionigenium maris DSM 9537]|uniref:Sodium:calcium antiporter n=1 Tax=Propionigenium maris DSM 9537 TaxID=1123000 RepID=A0A9W6GIJ7_9FUSO|nr:hypothetical protein [Propionigenium maris]GLI54539.1 sodium:calcium antiporter [Propionigenium maris DSM 9537]